MELRMAMKFTDEEQAAMTKAHKKREKEMGVLAQDAGLRLHKIAPGTYALVEPDHNLLDLDQVEKICKARIETAKPLD
jgi:hypothetical protein